MKVIAQMIVGGEEIQINLSDILPVAALPRVGDCVIVDVGLCEVTDVIWDFTEKIIVINIDIMT